MFIGHFGIGLGAKKLKSEISLGTLFFAAQFVDLLWPTLLLIGVERVEVMPGATAVTPLEFISYPISHSLLFAVIWGSVIGGLYMAIRKNVRGAVLLGLLVLSHWVLDLIVHHPDLPITPGESVKVGLGLWDSLAGTLAVEGVIFAVGTYVYARITRARDSVGHYGFWGLIVFLVLIHLSNLFGSPPPSATAIAWVGQAQWLLVVWAYWIDRHRSVAV
ncbi:MAG: hypothetical protein Kow0074_13350 [Candidatus Zixiibacteriota bacterium]